MCSVSWAFTCHECECPIDVSCVIKDRNYNLFIRDFTTWCYLKPFSIACNTYIYKFYGMSLKRVCMSCYYCPKRINLCSREIIGRSVKFKKCPYQSKSKQELYDYFESFFEFRKRKDLEICIVEEKKRKYLLGLMMYY